MHEVIPVLRSKPYSFIGVNQVLHPRVNMTLAARPFEGKGRAMQQLHDTEPVWQNHIAFRSYPQNAHKIGG